jgi:hypothetical protein
MLWLCFCAWVAVSVWVGSGVGVGGGGFKIATQAAPHPRGVVSLCALWQDGWREWLFFKLEQDRVMIQWLDGDDASWAMYRTLNKAQKQRRKETWATNVDEAGVSYWTNQHTGKTLTGAASPHHVGTAPPPHPPHPPTSLTLVLPLQLFFAHAYGCLLARGCGVRGPNRQAWAVEGL